MDRKFILLFILFLGTGVSFGQYLKYQEMADLLFAAEDRTKAESFLEERGFENVWAEEHGDGYSIDYNKNIGDEEYSISITVNFFNETYTAVEYTSNDDRWEYYSNILHSKGYVLVKSYDDDEKGYTYEYAGKDFNVTIVLPTVIDEGSIYKIIFQR